MRIARVSCPTGLSSTMNMLKARKDRLIDLPGTPLPPASRQQLTSELADLKRDIAKVRYGVSEHDWYETQRKWGRTAGDP